MTEIPGFSTNKSVFFHGIGGAGMRGLAWIVANKGMHVSGCDADPNTVKDLSTFTIAPETDAENLLMKADLYIHTDAVPTTHALYQQAVSQNIPILPYHKALAELTKSYELVAVTGTHGKSSTTAFLAHILQVTNHDPSALVGATVPSWPGKHALVGTSNIFVTEADEYRNHFLELTPTHAIIPTIEYDHPDFFTHEDDMWAAFQAFVNRIPPTGFIITTKSLSDAPLTWPKHTTFIDENNLPLAPIPGTHMQMNAKLAIAAAVQLGVPHEQATSALQSFPGLGRRFEKLGTIENLLLISDYAHHPTEITATIAAARNTYADLPIIIVFEAHMAERLEAFNQEFAEALALADTILLYPPYLPAGREGAHANALRDKLAELLSSQNKTVHILNSAEDLPDMLTKLSEQKGVVIACTAGRLDAQMREIAAS